MSNTPVNIITSLVTLDVRYLKPETTNFEETSRDFIKPTEKKRS